MRLETCCELSCDKKTKKKMSTKISQLRRNKSEASCPVEDSNKAKKLVEEVRQRIEPRKVTFQDQQQQPPMGQNVVHNQERMMPTITQFQRHESDTRGGSAQMPMQSMQSMQSMQPMQPMQQQQPIQPVQSVQSVQQIQQIQPMQPMQSAPMQPMPQMMPQVAVCGVMSNGYPMCESDCSITDLLSIKTLKVLGIFFLVFFCLSHPLALQFVSGWIPAALSQSFAGPYLSLIALALISAVAHFFLIRSPLLLN